MNLSEVLESVAIYRDDKSPRRLNTAPDRYADISLEEIEKGVTIERLEQLSVPVYQYGQQITIHGKFYDIPSDLRVAGYKSVFLNKNRSLGVRYVAIDGNKKRLLEQVSRYSTTGWRVYIDSSGCQAVQIFHTVDNEDDKRRLIECYNSTPDKLYIGCKEAGALMYGGYAVILHIGAVYESNLWPLIGALTGISNEDEYNAIVSEEMRQDELKRAEYERIRLEREEERKTKTNEAMNSFNPPSNWQRFTGNITKEGTYARIRTTYDGGITLSVKKVVKRGGYLCSAGRHFDDFNFVDWKPDKYHRLYTTAFDGWRILDDVQTPAYNAKALDKQSNNSYTIEVSR